MHIEQLMGGGTCLLRHAVFNKWLVLQATTSWLGNGWTSKPQTKPEMIE